MLCTQGPISPEPPVQAPSAPQTLYILRQKILRGPGFTYDRPGRHRKGIAEANCCVAHWLGPGPGLWDAQVVPVALWRTVWMSPDSQFTYQHNRDKLYTQNMFSMDQELKKLCKFGFNGDFLQALLNTTICVYSNNLRDKPPASFTIAGPPSKRGKI